MLNPVFTNVNIMLKCETLNHKLSSKKYLFEHKSELQSVHIAQSCRSLQQDHHAFLYRPQILDKASNEVVGQRKNIGPKKFYARPHHLLNVMKDNTLWQKRLSHAKHEKNYKNDDCNVVSKLEMYQNLCHIFIFSFNINKKMKTLKTFIIIQVRN